MKSFATTRLSAVFLCVGLAACSDPAPPPAAEAPAPAAATTERSTPQAITRENQGVLTDTQAAGINRANQVSNVLEDAEKERRRQLEAAGQ
jgi:hypothetical protein